MKAMVLRAPRDLGAIEVKRPTPGQDQALVRVTHSGVCGTDLKIFKGAIPVRYPLIMGHEMVGEVVEGGDESLRPGDRVIIDPVNYCGMCENCRGGKPTCVRVAFSWGATRTAGLQITLWLREAMCLRCLQRLKAGSRH